MKHVKKNFHRKSSKQLPPHLLDLPADFAWQLLRSVLSDCSDEIGQEPNLSGFVDQANAALRRRDPSLYYELEDKWGLQRINSLGGGMRHESVSCARLVTSLLRKSTDLPLVEPKARRADCLKKVVAVDDNLKFRGGDDEVLRRISVEILLLIGECPDMDKVMDNAKHGPGTSLFGGHMETASYYKYIRWPYVVGSEARCHLQTLIEKDPRWLGALEDSYRRRYKIKTWSILDRGAFWSNVLLPVTFNKISVVPKDGRKDRPIAVEPMGSMLLQLGVDRVFRRCLLENWHMDLNSAVLNRRSAREGSLDSSPVSPATLDLSNASDTIHWKWVERFFPPAWFKLLMSLRCPFGQLPCGTGLVYNKISSMGNGYTFALESVFFLAILRAVSAVYGSPSDRLLAYGDDLVFPQYLLRPVVYYLGWVGCEVNLSKTFSAGPVRESCGEDYYEGVNIRPVYLKRIDDICDLVSLRNRLCEWSRCTWGEYRMTNTDRFLLQYYGGEPLIGPRGSNHGDSTWIYDPLFSCRDRVLDGLSRSVPRSGKGREFLLGRLIHDLRTCELESPRFSITVRGRGTVNRSGRFVSYSDAE